MQSNLNLKLDLSSFIKDIKLKKNYINLLNEKIYRLNDLKEKNFKEIESNFFRKNENNPFSVIDNKIMYIVNIHFSKSNTLFTVMDFSGKVKVFYSAGIFNYKGKQKRYNRFLIVKHFLNLAASKLKFLQNKPIALHLKNVGRKKNWAVRLFKLKNFYIKLVKTFNTTAHNGCRKKKVRRRKFKRKKRRNG